MDEKQMSSKVKAAKISHFTFISKDDHGNVINELWLYRKGAARQYPQVTTEADLDKAIAEFQKNAPPA